MPADPGGVPGLSTALCELFLANADRGDNAANDHLIAEMVARIRTQQEQLKK